MNVINVSDSHQLRKEVCIKLIILKKQETRKEVCIKLIVSNKTEYKIRSVYQGHWET